MGRALTIGNFDGVHVGHRRIIQRIKELKNPLVFTFSNHPSEVLQQKPKPLLTHPEHKLTLLESLDVEVVVEPFTTAFAQQSPEKFLQKFELSHLVLGPDAAFGYNRSGHSGELERLSQKMGFKLEYLEAARVDSVAISSSHIRSVIERGDFATALPLLGRPYSIQGRVIRGAGRGLGIPTANIDVSSLCLPPSGVYVVRCQERLAVANLGTAPTFNGQKKQLEVHILDFDEDLYGEMLDVTFVRFLRPEKKFSSKEELKKQIEEDLKSARRG